MNEKDKFILKTEDGKESTFYKLIDFKSNITNKKYLVYADENKKLYGSILLDDNENDIKLEKLADETDIEEVNKAILQVKNSMKEN